MRGVVLYLGRRLVWAGLVSITAIVLTFLLVRMAPGNPIAVLAGEQATPEYQRELAARLGLDQPLWVQLIRYLGSLVQGDLGYSFTYRAPVADVISARFAPTLALMGVTLLISILIGIWVGVRSAAAGRSRFWWGVNMLTLMAYSLPAFWLGQVLVLFFGVKLGWFPTLGLVSDVNATGFAMLKDMAWHLVLPAATISVIQVALIARLTETAMREALASDYIVAARGKGVAPARVIWGHALRNALLPVVTVIGLELGWVVAGFVVVETVFSWPGLGSLTSAAIDARDYPVITGLFIVITVSVILANLLTDLVYLAIDPRIRVV